MDLSRLLRPPSDGWRKTGVINTIILGFFAIAMCSLLLWSIVKADGNFSQNTIFIEGDCGRMSQLNTALHLLLNIASSLIIASSNFFMQILNSPTRAEVDHAHARRRWLEIGVPSLRNALHVSPYKSFAWVLFSLSSIPIHLLFNSAVFQVDYSGSEWSMAIVSESFLQGAKHYLPGASLVKGGTSCYGGGPYPVATLSPAVGEIACMYGSIDQDEDFISNQILPTIMATATHRLSASACKSEYTTCQALRNYRNLVMVIASEDEPTGSKGWTVNNTFDMGQAVGDIYDLKNGSVINDTDTFGILWEPYYEDITMAQMNSLWFTSPCAKVADKRSVDGCFNLCGGALGTNYSIREPGITKSQAKSSNWTFTWWNLDKSNITWGSNVARQWSQYNPGNESIFWPYFCEGVPQPPFLNTSGANNIRVKYCLAEPFQPGCKLGISSVLLLVVVVCVFTKLLLCIMVIEILRDDPLVTPGDAVASFICLPDPITAGKCAVTNPNNYFRLLDREPYQWDRIQRRLAYTASTIDWARSYAFFALVLGILGYLMRNALIAYPLSVVSSIGTILSHEQNMLNGGVFKESWFPTGNFIASVMLANAPQLILSLTYFAYNALFTRLLAEAEWQSLGMGYRPLRVTRPRGEQWSTYRLQLPYRYSIPLLATSILLHWITSNAIFVFMSDGGYYREMVQSTYLLNGVEAESLMLVGYSSPAIVIGFSISLFLIVLPLLLGSTKLRGSMIISRSNSMIISAACHVSVLSNSHPTSSNSKSATWDNALLDGGTFSRPAGYAEDWGSTATAAISAVMGDDIEFQPLVSDTHSRICMSSCSTIVSPDTRRSVSTENAASTTAAATVDVNLTIRAPTAGQFLSPPPLSRVSSIYARTGRQIRASSTNGREVEGQPLLSSQLTGTSINTINFDDCNSNAASYDGTVYAEVGPFGEDVGEDTGFQRHVVSAGADSEHEGSTAGGSSLGADGPDEMLAAARRLESGSECEEDDAQFRLRLSRSKIRWGVVRMPDEFYAQFGDMEEGVELGHLSFGTEEQGVVPPVEGPGHVYA